MENTKSNKRKNKHKKTNKKTNKKENKKNITKYFNTDSFSELDEEKKALAKKRANKVKKNEIYKDEYQNLAHINLEDLDNTCNIDTFDANINSDNDSNATIKNNLTSLEEFNDNESSNSSFDKIKTYNDNLKNSKVIKLNSDIKRQNFISEKRFIVFSILFVLLPLILLVIRLFYIQFIQGDELKQMAYNQQTSSEVISAKRGNIYDTNGKALAIGAQVDTITINPTLLVKDTEEETLVYKETIALKLSEIFELDYDSTYTKVSSSSSYQTVARQVSQDKVDLLTTWMSESGIYSGITIESDNTRFYPYDTVASAVIGFCNYANQGAYGIEETWNDVLSGTSRKSC